jgi:hypothetical protein
MAIAAIAKNDKVFKHRFIEYVLLKGARKFKHIDTEPLPRFRCRTFLFKLSRNQRFYSGGTNVREKLPGITILDTTVFPFQAKIGELHEFERDLRSSNKNWNPDVLPATSRPG